MLMLRCGLRVEEVSRLKLAALESEPAKFVPHNLWCLRIRVVVYRRHRGAVGASAADDHEIADSWA